MGLILVSLKKAKLRACSKFKDLWKNLGDTQAIVDKI